MLQRNSAFSNGIQRAVIQCNKTGCNTAQQAAVACNMAQHRAICCKAVPFVQRPACLRRKISESEFWCDFHIDPVPFQPPAQTSLALLQPVSACVHAFVQAHACVLQAPILLPRARDTVARARRRAPRARARWYSAYNCATHTHTQHTRTHTHTNARTHTGALRNNDDVASTAVIAAFTTNAPFIGFADVRNMAWKA
jgi:hypothetical protein